MKNLTTDDVLDIICTFVLIAGIIASIIFKYYSQIGYIIISIILLLSNIGYRKENIKLKEDLKEEE